VSTTVHIPKKLLEQVDARAKSLGVSRNRLVVEALREKVNARDSWSPELLEMLRTPIDEETVRASHVLENTIRRTRRSRRAPVSL
jgi:predicted transcriptional regulator